MKNKYSGQEYEKDYDVLNSKQKESRKLLKKIEKDIEGQEMEEDNKVICPVCNRVVTDFDEGIHNPCEHVFLMYTDALNGEFIHTGKGASKVELELLKKYGESDGDMDLSELMEEFANASDKHTILTLTTSGMACGPVSNTDYIMFKIK